MKQKEIPRKTDTAFSFYSKCVCRLVCARIERMVMKCGGKSLECIAHPKWQYTYSSLIVHSRALAMGSGQVLLTLPGSLPKIMEGQ